VFFQNSNRIHGKFKKKQVCIFAENPSILGKFHGDSARDLCDPSDFPAILQLRIPHALSNGWRFKDRGIVRSR